MSEMENAKRLLALSSSALRCELDADEADKLANEIVGAFNGFPVVGKNIVQYAGLRDWAKLCGALGMYIDQSIQGGAAVSVMNSVNAQATANVVAHVSLAEAIEAVESIPGITPDNAEELQKLVLAVDSATKKKDEGMLKHALKSLIDKAIDKGIEALPAVLPYMASAVQGFMG